MKAVIISKLIPSMISKASKFNAMLTALIIVSANKIASTILPIAFAMLKIGNRIGKRTKKKIVQENENFEHVGIVLRIRKCDTYSIISQWKSIAMT